MQLLFIVLTVLAGVVLFTTIPLARRLFGRASHVDITAEWLESFSVERYRAMETLLAQEDFDFLSRQPGFDRSLRRKLRRERLRIFREYLNRLVSDFNRIHLVIRLQLAQSGVDQSEVATRLFQVQWRFRLALLKTELRYFLSRYIYLPIDVAGLLQALEAVNWQMTRNALAAQS